MLETPEKPVTAAKPEASMWSLGFALGLSADEARRFERLFDHVAEQDENVDPDLAEAILLGHAWQQLTSQVSDGSVIAPWANELHHQVADALERRGAAGKTVKRGAGGVATCPSSVRLPCRDCGHMFLSTCRGGRFRRTCGKCFAYSPSPPEHPRGGLTGYTAGMYTHRRAGSKLGVEQYGQEVLCSHPDCLRLFMSTRGDEEYCDEHAGKREQARRLRSRGGPPKHLRFRFELAPGLNGAQYSHGPNTEEVRLEPGITHVARDERELAQLASFLELGTVIALDTAEPIGDPCATTRRPSSAHLPATNGEPARASVPEMPPAVSTRGRVLPGPTGTGAAPSQ